MRRVISLVALALTLALAAAGHAAPIVKFRTGLTPEHLGTGTTITISFKIMASDGGVPPPLTTIKLLYPANFGIGSSGLGLTNCTTTILEFLGPPGCASTSKMGYGTALAEVQIGPALIQEHAHSTTYMAPLQNGALSLLFAAEAPDPIDAELFFPGTLQPANPPYGGRLETTLPLVPSVPGAPDVSVIELTTTIGPLHLTYYEHHHGHIVSYTPPGILLPPTCPKHGFPFTATLSFQDGSQAEISDPVACPDHKR